jgi:hypothetical protein
MGAAMLMYCDSHAIRQDSPCEPSEALDVVATIGVLEVGVDLIVAEGVKRCAIDYKSAIYPNRFTRKHPDHDQRFGGD